MVAYLRRPRLSGGARQRGGVAGLLISAVVATFAMGRLADHIGPLPVSLLCSLIQIGSLVGFMFVARHHRHLRAVGDPRHSLHRHRPGLCADPALALRADHRRLAAGRGHAVRHGRHGGRRLAGRRHLRRDARPTAWPSRRRWPSTCSISCCWARSTSPSAGGWSACLECRLVVWKIGCMHLVTRAAALLGRISPGTAAIAAVSCSFGSTQTCCRKRSPQSAIALLPVKACAISAGCALRSRGQT